MKIELSNTEAVREYTDVERKEGDKSRKVVYFTLTDDEGNEYKMLDDLPASADPQVYLDENIEKEMLFVLQEQYPEKPEGLNTLKAFQEWIAGGCVLKTAVKGVFKDRWEDVKV
jgi:hypothetical protein